MTDSKSKKIEFRDPCSARPLLSYPIFLNPLLSFEGPSPMSLPDEMWGVVASFCPDGATWKVLRLISKVFYRVCEPMNRDMVDRFCNPLLSLLKKFPKKNWDWEGVSANPGVSWEFIKANPYLPWNWKIVAHTKKIPTDEVYLDGKGLKTRLGKTVICWDIHMICGNRYMAEPLVRLSKQDLWKETFVRFPRNLVLSRVSSHVPAHVVRANPHEPWDWRYSMSQNPNVTWELVSENMDKPWDWELLTSNPGITCEALFSEGTPWVDSHISANPNITPRVVKEHPDVPWNYIDLSRNPNLTLDFVRENLDKGWDWRVITLRTSTHTMTEHPEIPWDRSAVPCTLYMGVRDMISSVLRDDLPWNIRTISSNILATYSEVCEYSTIWDWKFLSVNVFRAAPFCRDLRYMRWSEIR